MSKVFISYSSKDKEWVVDWLMPRLEAAGIQVKVDFRDFKVGIPSLDNMTQAVEDCDKIMLVMTPNWMKSEWTAFESLVAQTIDPTGRRGSIIPLMLEQCDLDRRLSFLTYANFKDRANWDNELARVLRQIKEEVPPEPVKKPEPTGPDKISISKLPTTHAETLFGRDDELALLDRSWQDHHIHILAFIAWGGVGKTCLVSKWLNFMEKEHFRGAEMVYCWSFYSQGARESNQASADVFLDETLRWFGDPDPTIGSATDRGRRLAGLVKSKKTLLILDGLEPLQHPPKQGAGLDGLIKDPGLKALVKDLALGNRGLCVITSREPLSDLHERRGKKGPVIEKNLERLKPEAGKKLLEKLGARGPAKEMAKAVEEFGGHALALTLLGRFIARYYGGDIRKRDEIPALSGAPIQGAHARRVMEAYEHWLGQGPQLAILRLMGLFDRPVERDALDALCVPPAIKGVTGGLNGAGPGDTVWKNAVIDLREPGLLAAENPEKPCGLDCHPLVREYFAERLQKDNAEGWKEAHLRLYEFYKQVPEKEEPDTLEEMEPLFAAVAHGCRAGLHQQAMIDVYVPRIMRDDEVYTINKLGAFGADLAALSHFFSSSWCQPEKELRDDAKAYVVNSAAFGLRALGRLHEAIEPMQAGLEMYEKRESWRDAARAAGNLGDLLLTLGRIAEAVETTHRAVDHAEQSKRCEERVRQRTILADALRREGRRAEAVKLFRQAEELQKKEWPHEPLLYSLQGYRYCDLLLDLGGKGRVQEVMERAEKAFESSTRNNQLLSIGLDHLTLGRTWMMKDDMEKACGFLNRAVEWLRKYGSQQHLPKGLLARAAFYRLTHDYNNALTDLDETKEIADFGSMKLYLVDYHLEYCRLNLDLKDSQDFPDLNKDQALVHLKEAERLVEETGYGLREDDVKRLKNKLKSKNAKVKS